ncbi:MAG: methylated-DNA--[protein]-cysteine S-methyltransferase [Saprospiraceae bacterium]
MENITYPTDFERIAEAIYFIRENFKSQPNLDAVAAKVHLSPFHFQRMFTEWSGVSPKKFLQYTSLGYAKSLLKDKSATLFDTAFETGLSGTGRLHDLFINIEGMTPGEYKNKGEHLVINYSFAETPFGKIMVASTPKGICHLAFVIDELMAFNDLKMKFSKASFHQLVDQLQQKALHIFSRDWTRLDEIKLHLKGSDFQLKVWEALLKVPMGALTTYGSIGVDIQSPDASRAVGTAIGDNPVAFLIPCHRVIRSNGVLGGYRWGLMRKAALIGWEGALINREI